MKVFSRLMVLILLILGVAFALVNAGPVTIHYYVGQKQLPLSLLLVFTFGFGILMTFFTLGIIIIRLKHERRKLKKKLKQTRQELDNLRIIPIKDVHAS